MKVVILCGGFGKRLWPLSSPSKPKQFLKLFKNHSLFQKTILRNIAFSDQFIIVVNENQLQLCKDQVKELGVKCTYINEPVSKNTATAITLAALYSSNETLLIVPSDHMISDNEHYASAIYAAQKEAQNDKLVTFGIRPISANTNYGYIEFDTKSQKALSFKEKPNFELASRYFESKTFLWNSGMFLFRSNTFLKEMNITCPNLLKQITKVYEQRSEAKNHINIPKDLMDQLDSISIDYALFEKSNNVSVIASIFNWSDMGTFNSLYKELYKDEFDLFNFYKK